MTLQETIDIWRDDKITHQFIFENFTKKVNEDERLKSYRDWIESNIFGFGERAFIWMWKLLCDEQQDRFRFLEVGVFRGQILGLIRMLKPQSLIYGITPLTSEGGHWESDYAADIRKLHDTFFLRQPNIIKGLSTDDLIIKMAKIHGPYDMVYIDGGHAYEVVKSDLKYYPPMVKPGGYLVIDDCCHKYDLPDGYFKGIDTVSRAVDEWHPNELFKEIFSVGHNRVFIKL